VRWTTVSTLDGHTLKGSYRFGVGAVASGDEQVEDSPISSEGWAGLLGRLGALAGLALWAGFAAMGGVAARAAVPDARLRNLARAGPVLALGGTVLSVVSTALVSTGSGAGVGTILYSSGSGRLRAGLIAASALGTLTGHRRLWGARLLAAAGLLAEAASGHAAGAPLPRLATVSFAVHLGAVGVWVFAITASALSGGRMVQALTAFSPYAIAAAGVVALTGLSNAVLELNRPSELLSTSYGNTVVGKVMVFATMASLGLIHNHRRQRAGAGRPDVERPVRLELGAAGLALVLATVLVGFPNPPREEGAVEPLTGIDPVLAGLGGRPALAVAEASGLFIVGLTILPPRLGEVTLRLQ
ncbi:MAG: copper resistance D family protein, partial [Acidimicrobiales bacterium]